MGCAFIAFSSPSIATAISKSDLISHYSRDFSTQENQVFQFENWKFQQAYFKNDIDWHGLNHKKSQSFVVNTSFNVILFLLSVVLVTPVSLYAIVDPIAKQI